MKDWNDYFEFENFVPSSTQTKVLRKSLDDLLWLSPSDSSLVIYIRKTPALFNARCIISSSCRKFAAEGMSENFIPALRIMQSGILRELNRWKQTRQINVTKGEEQRVS